MKTIYLSHSRVAQFLTCPSRYRFSNLFTRVRRDGFTAFAPDVGTALHRAMQHYMKHGVYDAAVWELGQQYPWPLYSDPTIRTDGGRNFFATLQAFDTWIETSPRLEYEIIKVDGRDAEELLVEVEIGSLGDLRFVYQMHIDLVCERRSYGDIRPVDIKTYTPSVTTADFQQSYGLDNRLQKYERSTQLLGYGLVTEMLLHKQWLGSDLHAEYWFLAIHQRVARLDIKQVSFTAEQVSLWMKNIISCCHSIYSQWHSDNWMRNEGSCHAWMQACPHIELCWKDLRREELESWYSAGVPQHMVQEPEVPHFTFQLPLLAN